MKETTIIRFYKEVVWGGEPCRLRRAWNTEAEFFRFATPRGPGQQFIQELEDDRGHIAALIQE